MMGHLGPRCTGLVGILMLIALKEWAVLGWPTETNGIYLCYYCVGMREATELHFGLVSGVSPK